MSISSSGRSGKTVEIYDEKALFGDSNGLDSAVNNLKKNAHEKIKESDEKYWGKETTFSNVLSIVLAVLFGVCAFVFIALGIGSKFKSERGVKLW